MKLVSLFFLSACVVGFNGCTVLGLATDMALNGAMDKDRCENSNHASCKEYGAQVLIFTVEGAKQDAKIVKTVLEKIKKTESELILKDTLPIPAKPKVVACKKVVNGQQQCFSADYYKDMYITTEKVVSPPSPS